MIASIIVDVTSSQVDKIFEYEIPETMTVDSGYRVIVPFGKRVIEGYVLKISSQKTTSHELKQILKVVDDFAVITKEQLSLAEYMKKHYHLRMVDVLHLFLPAKSTVKAKFEVFYKLNADFDLNKLQLKSNAKKQKSLLEALKNGQLSQTEINSVYGNSALNALKKAGVVEEVKVRQLRQVNITKKEDKEIEYTASQQNAIKEIMADNGTKVLFGVTGSGKTEVYMKCIDSVLKNGKTAIMLVPEISLTPQTMSNFVARFGNNVALIHSGLSQGERYDQWEKILKKEVKIVVGARSAIFSPIENLGLIIIDEEHNTSYFSESNPRYYTHEIALFRSKYNTCPLVLGSATPSTESMMRASTGEFKLVKMPNRVNNFPLPEIEIVDMVNELRNGNNSIFSKKFVSYLKKTIENKNQAMIFLNRRGFQSTVRCLNCGYVAKCLNCDVSLVYHKDDNQLKCHFCNMRYKNLTQCPECGSQNFRYGAIGTQKVVEEIEKLFPKVKVFRMDNDTTRGKDGHNTILTQFRNTFPSVLVGTQMIAKGHDYPLVTFVGIVDADASLHFADYRASEKTFSLITQVAGRAGRAGKEGVVVLQTYTPKHSLYKTIANYDYDAFYKKELEERKLMKFPPYTKMVRILLASESQELISKITKQMFEKCQELRKEYNTDIVYLDAMKSPVKKIQNKIRYQILFRIQNNINEIIDKIYAITDEFLSVKDISIFVEINPQSLQ